MVQGTIGAVRGAVVALVVWLLSAACVRAEDSIVLFQSGKLRSGLCAALRIQLSDVAQVRCVADAFGNELPARIAGAARLVQSEQARLGVLLERDPNPKRVRMYIVAARTDQAVIAIERIEDRPEPDVDRSLALKVRDALDVVSRAVLPPTPATTEATEPAPPAAEATLPPNLLVGVIAPRLSEAPKGPETEAADASLPWAAVLEAGGGALFGNPATRGAGRLLAGGRFNGTGVSGELLFGARIHGPVSQKSAAGVVDEGEWGPELSLRALWSHRRLQLGAFAEAMWLSMDARGSTNTGARGTKKQRVLTSSLGVDMRLRLFTSAFVRLAPALEVLSVAQRFAVDERVTLDIGRTRVLLPISFLVALPVGGDE